MNIDINKLLNEVSNETGTSKFQTEMVYKSMFEMIAETMREKNADNILLPTFGKFIVPRKKLSIIDPKKFKEKYKDDINN